MNSRRVYSSSMTTVDTWKTRATELLFACRRGLGDFDNGAVAMSHLMGLMCSGGV